MAFQATADSLLRGGKGSRASAPMNKCLDGCGQMTRGRFVPGHDAKLRSRLLRELRNGNKQQAEKAGNQLIDLQWYEAPTVKAAIKQRFGADGSHKKAAKKEKEQASEPAAATAAAS